MTETMKTVTAILALMERAADLRVMERAAYCVKVASAVRTALVVSDDLRGRQLDADQALLQARLAKTQLRLLVGAVESDGDLGEHAIQPVEPRRYAAVLMLDDPELSPDDALRRAEAELAAWSQYYSARVHGDEPDQDDTNDDI